MNYWYVTILFCVLHSYGQTGCDNPLDLPEEFHFCEGGFVTITAPSGYNTYEWSTNQTSTSITISEPGIYTLETEGDGVNTVVNSQFDSGNSGFSSGYGYVSDGSGNSELYPEGLYSIVTNANNVHPSFSGFGFGGSGNFMIVNGAVTAGTNVWCQTIGVMPNTWYNFSTYVTNSVVGGSNPAQLNFSINGLPIGLLFNAPSGTGTWQQFNAQWYSGNQTAAQICIVNSNTLAGGNDFGLDNIQFVPVCIYEDEFEVIEHPIYEADIYAEICAGDIYDFDGLPYTQENIYDIQYNTQFSCDSIVHLNLTVLEPSSHSVDFTICPNEYVQIENELVNFQGTNTYLLTNSVGCDSLLEVNISYIPALYFPLTFELCENESLLFNSDMLYPGAYYELVYATNLGCDTLYQITVESLPIHTTEVIEYTCQGDLFYYQNTPVFPNMPSEFNFQNAQGCDSIVTIMVEELPVFDNFYEYDVCANDSFQYQTQYLFPNSEEEFSYLTIDECDSLVTIKINELPTYFTTDTVYTCENSVITYLGEDLNPETVQDFQLTSTMLCDSIVKVAVLPYPIYNDDVTLQACVGTSIEFDGVALLPNSVTDFEYQTISFCDSIVVVTVEEIDDFYEEVEWQTCPDEPINYDGEVIAPGEELAYSYESVLGCDSVVLVQVSPYPTYFETITEYSCANETFAFDGALISPETTELFTYITTENCDSTIEVSIIGYPIYEEDVLIEICEGEVPMFDSQILDPAVVQTFQYQTLEFCDSILQVSVQVHPIYYEEIEVWICDNKTFMFDNQELLPNIDQQFDYSTINSCDSTIIVSVLAYATFQETINLQSCAGISVNFDNTTLAPGSVTDFIYTTINDCDSLVVVEVEEIDQYNNDVYYNICTGETFEFDGDLLLPNSQTFYNYTSTLGCDSIVLVHVEESLVFFEEVSFDICESETMLFDGSQLLPNTITDFSYQTASECDSVIVVEIIGHPEYDILLTEQVCTGFSTIINDVELFPGETEVFQLFTDNLCDSIVTVDVIAVDVIETNLSLIACSGEIVVFENQTLQIGDVHVFDYISSGGCDSLLTVSVEEVFSTSEIIEVDVCTDEAYIFEETEVFAGQEMAFVLENQNSCDSLLTIIANEIFHQERDTTFYICTGGSINFLGVDLYPDDQLDWTFTGQNGCDSIVHFITTAIPPPEFHIDTLVCPQEVVQINNENYIAPVDVTVTLQNTNACDSLVIYHIGLLQEDTPVMYFPSAFSPNTDTFNDAFQPVLTDQNNIINYQIQIFDRWGNLVFTTVDINESWNGDFKNQPLEIGVYVYLVEFETMFCNAMTEQQLKGNITLMR